MELFQRARRKHLFPPPGEDQLLPVSQACGESRGRQEGHKEEHVHGEKILDRVHGNEKKGKKSICGLQVFPFKPQKKKNHIERYFTRITFDFLCLHLFVVKMG